MTAPFCKVILRPCEERDREFVWELRNDELVIDGSWSGKVPEEGKDEWLEKTIRRRKSWKPYIVKINGRIAGRISYELRPLETEVSIALHKDFRGKGYAVWVIKRAVEFAKLMNWPECMATIKPLNIRSQRAFERAGFWPRNGKWVCIQRKPATVF